jgi:polar amino acid transport system ATP-binding protein
MLTVNNATKKFGKLTVFNNINLEIKDSSIVGLAGPSGSGKSTLLRAIQGLEKLDQGSINYEGSSGFMFQDFQLFNHMSVIDNLTYAPNLVFKDKNYQEEALKLLQKLDISDKAETYPLQLSGGQKQRVALARSLMMKPKLLLCDEPTSGLDVATIGDVVNLLKSVQELGVTMVIASHDLDFLTKITNRIIVLKHGKIAVDANLDQTDNPIHYLKTFY